MWEWDQLGLWSGLGRKKPTLCPPPEPPSMSLSSSRIYVPCHMQAGENCSHWFIWGKLLPIPKQTWVPFSQKDAWRFWGPVKSKAQSLNTPTGLFAARTGGSWVPKHPKLCNVRTCVSLQPVVSAGPWGTPSPGGHRGASGAGGEAPAPRRWGPGTPQPLWQGRMPACWIPLAAADATSDPLDKAASVFLLL